MQNNKCNCGGVLLKRLQQSLQDVSEQLQISNKKIEELASLLKIVSEEKTYYYQELQKSQGVRQQLEGILLKNRKEGESRNLLVNELKKANRELQEDMMIMKDSLEETKFLFDAQEQQIDRIRKQKSLIEGEWNKVIKQVNLKMNIMNRKQEIEEKENVEIYSNLPLKDKVKKALRKIDREILQEQELIGGKKRGERQNRKSMVKSTTSNQSMSDIYVQ